ncbi:hypothetical protein SADUNF_Sadunf19G0056100 [Salix dunnii]|uniref:Inositol-tetrakisphosphate 1-kinase n=1 Tax=Salix dunnii TaxID=1413687 RepID=A0A835IYK4_9ROSI|nr:hypothetical protein SADUNF_Sadunf19G0056100 [Salix dunnii]
MSSSTHSKRHRVGYALPPKKIQAFIQPSLIHHADQHSIDLIPIDPSKPLIEQGPLDCVIHKLYGQDWMSQLLHFSSLNPDALIIDPLDSIERIHNRVSMLHAVSNLQVSERKQVLDVPRQQVFFDSETMMKNSDDLIQKLGFPLIAKPLMADGSETSHKMYLVFDKEGIDKLETQGIIMQEFVNHGGVIFKVYVVGDFVKCVKRKSLPDIKEDKLVSLKGLLPFSQISNLEEKSDCGGGEFDRVEMPPVDFVEEVAKAMKEETGISLLNFDVIRDATDANRYLIIDINYFPGYEKIPNYESVLTDFLLKAMEKNKSGDVSMVRERDDD